MQTINFTPYKTAPSFGALKIKGTEGMQFIKKDSPNVIEKLDVIKNELSKHNYWDLMLTVINWRMQGQTKYIRFPLNRKKC